MLCVSWQINVQALQQATFTQSGKGKKKKKDLEFHVDIFTLNCAEDTTAYQRLLADDNFLSYAVRWVGGVNYSICCLSPKSTTSA